MSLVHRCGRPAETTGHRGHRSLVFSSRGSARVALLASSSLALALVPAVVSRAAPGVPVIVTGSVVPGSAGPAQPLGGLGGGPIEVTVLTWPSLRGMSVGQSQQPIVVASAAASATGGFTLAGVPDPVVLSTLASGGYATFEVVATDGQGATMRWINRRWQHGRWEAVASSPASVRLALPSAASTAPSTPASSSRVSPGAAPQGAACYQARSVTGTFNTTDKVGLARGGDFMSVSTTIATDASFGAEISAGPSLSSMSATGSYQYTTVSGGSSTEQIGPLGQRFDTYTMGAAFTAYNVSLDTQSSQTYQFTEIWNANPGLPNQTICSLGNYSLLSSTFLDADTDA